MRQVKLPHPLYIEEDRYNGCYSGAKYLAFNMNYDAVSRLGFDAGDIDCEQFWKYEAQDYIIGKGSTPELALIDLITLLEKQEKKT